MKVAGIKIRSMRQKDLKYLAKIYVRSFKIYRFEEWTEKTAYEMIKNHMKKQPDMSFVAEYMGKIAGAFVGGIKPWWDGNHLIDSEFFIDPQYQKKGIGTLLLKTILEKAKEKYGISTYEAITFNTKFPIRWYRSIGLEEMKDYILISGNASQILQKLNKRL